MSGSLCQRRDNKVNFIPAFEKPAIQIQKYGYRKQEGIRLKITDSLGKRLHKTALII